MIIEWCNNVAGFVGAHQWYTVGQPWWLQSRISITSATEIGGGETEMIPPWKLHWRLATKHL